MTDRRAAIRAELEQARAAFHELAGGLSEADWGRPSAVPGWSVGAVIVHVLIYPASVIPRGVEAARSGKSVGGFPPWLVKVGLADWANKWGMKLMARRETPGSVREKYDRAHDGLVELLETVRDDEWGKATYALGEQMTVEELFRVHPRHFQEHRAEL